MAVGVNIISDFDGKGIQKAIAQFKKLETSSEKAAFALKKAFLPAVAALGGLAFAGFKAAQAAAADELEQAKLAQTLEKVVGATSATVASTEKMIESMSRASGTADTELREALSSLVIGTKDLTQAEQGLALAQDIATASNLPLQSAADALSKAYSGNYKALQKLSPALRDLIKDGASTEVIFADLANTFGGATANAADTAAGKMKILKNNVAEFQESLGAALLPALENITSVMTVVFGFMADNEKIVLALAAAVGFLALAITAYNIALKIGTIVNVSFGASAAAAAVAAAPLAAFAAVLIITIVALAAAVVLAYKRFEVFRDIVRAVFNGLIQIVEVFVNLFVAAWNVVVNVINAAITVANFFGADLKKLGTVGYVSLGRVSEASKMTEQQLKNLERQALQTAGAVRMIVTPEAQLKVQADRYEGLAISLGKTLDYTGKFYKETAAGGSGGGAVESATEKLSKYIDAIKGVTSAQRSVRDATKGVTESNLKLSEAISGTSKAQANFNKVTKGYALDSAEVVKQTREVANAQRNLIKANISAADSVQAIKDAEEALQKLREKVDPFDIESAEIKLQKAKYDVEEADFAVLEAEKDLAKLRKDKETTPQEIRQAEIKLAESKFGVRDAVKSVKDAEKELNKLRTDTPTLKEIAAAERAVADAKLAVEDASVAQADAQTSVNEAQAKLNELVDGAKVGSDAYTEALKSLTEAEEAEREAADARISAYEKLADATRDLAKAEQERSDASKGVSKKDRDAADAQEAAAVAASVIVPPFVRAVEPVVEKVAEIVTSLPSIVDAIVSLPSIVSPITQDQLDQIGAIGRGDFSNIDLGDQIIRIPSLEELLGGGIGTFMANGGVVTRATSIIAGEAGAEAIIPLDRLGSFGSTYNISVTAGMGADGKDIGTQIVNALKRYERTNGALPLTVA